MLDPGRYYVNTQIRLNANFTDSNGAAVDPDTVTFRTYSPNGTKASYVNGTDTEIGNPAVGSYTADIIPNRAGRWFYRWETTGTGKIIAIEGSFIIQKSVFFDNSEVGYALP